MPLLSIIIPCYNVEKYIKQCLDSIMSQSDVEFEIIAVDDGSPDNCPQILDDYAAKDSRVRVIHQENGGVSRARNAGIIEAKGDYLYFVDSDDWLVENSLAKAVNMAVKKDVDILFCDCLEQFDSGRENRIHLYSQEFTYDSPADIERIQRSILCHKMSPYFSAGADSAYPAPWSKIIKASLVKDNGIAFDPAVCGVYDDGLFTIEILEKAKKIAYSDICVYNYRILSSSIVHSYRKGMIERFEKNCFAIDEYIKRYNKSSEFVSAEYARRIAYLSSFMSSYFFSSDNQNSNKEKYNELRDTIDREPWHKAVQNASYCNLETKHKYTLFCMKHVLVGGLRLYSSLKNCLLH
ncbi:Glycosyltransferase involved in cell wall bisynthesis [Oscillospiraceae bacterium]|nr:Glycosyltransferase involved in cell wall bisynthesis [Oscillospiraceae bacterium]